MNQGVEESKSKKTKGYQNLRVWVEAHKLALLVYEITKYYPKSETYGLVSQMRRCAVSVAANIVEGQVRHSRKDFVRFLQISVGSLLELEYYFELSRDLEYITTDKCDLLDNQRQIVGAMLWKLMQTLKEDVKNVDALTR